MNYSLLYLAPVLPAVALVVSDFKSRQISLFWLIFFTIVLWSTCIVHNSVESMLYNLGFNCLLLVNLSCGILVYLKIKYKKWTNPLKSHIGLGDVLFLLIISPLFENNEYLIFILISITLSLLWWIVIFLTTHKNSTIPFVGTLGISLIMYLTYKGFIVW